MALDISKLTMGEVAKIEQLSGQAISAIGDEGSPKGLSMAALAYVVKRREDPKYTWNAAQDLTFSEAQDILGLDGGDEEEASDESGPTSGPSKPPASGKTPKKPAKA